MKYKLKKLVRAAKSGDKNSSEIILNALKPLIISSIKKYEQEGEDYEELIQEGYLKVLQLIQSYDESKKIPFLGYIKAQLKYFFLNYFKRKQAMSDSLEYEIRIGDKVFPIAEYIIDDSPTVLEQYIENEEFLQLLQEIKKLTPKQRKVIELYYYQQMPLTDIAKSLGVSYMSVVKVKKRALDKIREKIDV